MNRDQAAQLISDLLKLMVTKKGSDLFITADFPPALKIDGVMTRASAQNLQPDHTVMLVRALMNDRVYRVNEIVERNFGLRLTKVEANSLTFTDASGVVYVKNF